VKFRFIASFIAFIAFIGSLHAFDYNHYADQIYGLDGCGPKKSFDKKKGIAFYEGGEFIVYTELAKAVVNRLAICGWLEPIDMKRFDNSKELWEYLSDNVKSDYIEFKKDAYFSSDWEESKRAKNISRLKEKITSDKDIDIILAMGTWAGQDLTNNQIDVDTFVMDSNDPIGSGIVQGSEYSGYDYLHSRVDPNRYVDHIKIFHRIFDFNNLGIAYEDSKEGRGYAALEDIRRASRMMGFNLKECVVNHNLSRNQKREKFIECYKTLPDKANAIYVTDNPAFDAKDIEIFASSINNKKIPSFSQIGSEGVKYGLLMSFSTDSYRHLGNFHADAIDKALNGSKPGNIKMLFEEPVILSLNLKTAEQIGWDPSVRIMGLCNEVYYDDKPNDF